MTLPVPDWQLLAAKFLAALTVIAAALILTAVHPITVGLLGRLDWGAAAGAYAGMLLTGALLASAGIFASTLTRNQVTAFISAFLIGFFFYMVGYIDTFMPLWLSPFTDFIGMDAHIKNMARGVIDSRDIVYYATFSGFFLFLAQVKLWLSRY